MRRINYVCSLADIVGYPRKQIKLGFNTDIPVYLYLSHMLHGVCETDIVLLINVFIVRSCVYCVNNSVCNGLRTFPFGLQDKAVLKLRLFSPECRERLRLYIRTTAEAMWH